MTAEQENDINRITVEFKFPFTKYNLHPVHDINRITVEFKSISM